MLKLTFTYKGMQWQIEGEDQQIVSFISSFPQGTMEIGNPKPALVKRRPRSKYRVTQQMTIEPATMLDQPLPSPEEIKRYLLSKPDYKHDLFEVQKHFFGRTFTSRGEEQRMYHRTIHQLREIRRVVEQERHGKFKETKGDIRGQKRYVFEPLQAVTLVS